MGGELGGKTFLQVFEQCPNIVEFVDALWVEKQTTGIFKKFYMYIRSMLQSPTNKIEHIVRATKFAKALLPHEVPSYLKRFVETSLPSI